MNQNFYKLSKQTYKPTVICQSRALKGYKVIIEFPCIKYFGNKQEIKRADPLGDSQPLQEAIIEKSKALIIVHNRIVQEEAKYNYLKNSLVTMTQNQSLDTLPRPHITR